MTDQKHQGWIGRRRFLQYAATATAAAVSVSACSKTITHDSPDTIDIGEGGIGALNFLYAVTQFNAAVYSRMILKPYANMSATETSLLTDIRLHDTAHRDWLKTVLSDNAIPTLSVDLTFIDQDRVKTLTSAQTLKDLAVTAFNSAAYLIADVNQLAVVFKMASVQARHAAVVRNMLNAGSFANSLIINDYGMDKSTTIPMVLAELNTHLKKRLSARELGYTPF